MRIETLTDEQIDRMAEYRDKWIRIGLSTEPANRLAAEAAIVQMYAIAGLAKPRIVWTGSPLSQGLTRAIIMASVGDSVGASVGASVRASVWASVGDSVRASVWASVGDSVWASVRDSVRASVGDSVWASVGDSVGASVGASVGDSVGASVRASVRDSVGDSGYGQHDAGWLAFYDYFREVVGLTAQTEKLVGLLEQAKHAGWYLPHKHICWISERHSTLEGDSGGRLHCATGPAVVYPDGWAIYAWRGVRMPARYIEERNGTTPQDILAEPNVEVRRCAMEIYGQGRFAQDAGATIDDVSTEHGAELLSLPLPADDPERVMKALRLTCPTTKHVYLERVPPDVGSALEALSWRFNLKPKEYQPKWQS